MIDYIQYAILGAIQGITEWLPVSSKAQVMTAAGMMGVQNPLDVAIFLHVGTLLAAIIYFRKDLAALFRMEHRYLLRFLFVSLVFTGLVGLPLYFLVVKPVFQSGDETLGRPITALIGVLLVATGIVHYRLKSKDRPEKSVRDRDSIFAGLLQGAAAMPGLSRSAMTMSALFFRGFEAKAAVRLSFMMSIFAVAAADVGLQVRGGFEITAPMTAGVAASFAVGMLTIGLMLRITERVRPWKFLVGFGLVSLALGVLPYAGRIVYFIIETLKLA
jgi:undecaprenyl-diphosphatase